MSVPNMVFSPVGGLNDASYSPTTPLSEAAIRAQIQGISDQIRDYINNTILIQYATNQALNQVIAGQVNTVDEGTGKKYAIFIRNGSLGLREVG